MNANWQYQVRIRLAPDYAAMARQDPSNEKLAPINALLMKHDARLKCQYDAFADYVAQAEKDGIEHYPLYRWTRETIENPAKKAKYLEAFTLYVNGEEVYEKDLADALEPICDRSPPMRLPTSASTTRTPRTILSRPHITRHRAREVDVMRPTR